MTLNPAVSLIKDVWRCLHFLNSDYVFGLKNSYFSLIEKFIQLFYKNRSFGHPKQQVDLQIHPITSRCQLITELKND